MKSGVKSPGCIMGLHTVDLMLEIQPLSNDSCRHGDESGRTFRLALP